jgi:hypothetical protein
VSLDEEIDYDDFADTSDFMERAAASEWYRQQIQFKPLGKKRYRKKKITTHIT